MASSSMRRRLGGSPLIDEEGVWCVRNKNKGLWLLLILLEWVREVGLGVRVRKGFGGFG